MTAGEQWRCKHCYYGLVNHVERKCLWGPLYFVPLTCEGCYRELQIDAEYAAEWVRYMRKSRGRRLCWRCACA